MKQEDMNPTEARFWKYLRKNPWCSTHICFAAAIWGRNLSEEIVKNHFISLVDEIEYDARDKELILKTLYFLNQDKVNLKFLERENYTIAPGEKEYLKIRMEKDWAYLSPWLENTPFGIHSCV